MSIDTHDTEHLIVRDDEEGLFSRDTSGFLIRQDDPSRDDYEKTVTLSIDGKSITVPLAKPQQDASGNDVLDLNGLTTPRYTTIYDAAATLYEKELGTDEFPIPSLCHVQHMTPVAVCRLCVVQIYGQKRGKRSAERKLLPACQHTVKEAMEVFTVKDPGKDGDRVRTTVRTLTEMLAADHLKPAPQPKELADQLENYNELGIMSRRMNANPKRCALDLFESPTPLPKSDPLAVHRKEDDTSPVFKIDHSACILCERCIRACGEVKDNNVIGRTGKGATAGIGFDLNDLMGSSDCVQCGECMVSCPTTAITFKPVAALKHKEGRYTKPISTPELLADPSFKGMPPKFLLWQQGLVVRRTFRKGDVICHQGEPGNTAFLIKKGKFKVEVFPNASKSFLGNFIGGRKPVFSAELNPANFIFGEMSCLSGSPRTADVIALESGEAWELRRNVLDRLMRLSGQRRRIEEQFRDHSLDLVLRSTNLLKDLPDFKDIVSFIRNKIVFKRLIPGQAFTRQGALGTDFFLVRLGYVKVSIATEGQEPRIISRGPGTTFGEVSLLGLTPEELAYGEEEVNHRLAARLKKASADKFKSLVPGKQTATCSALDYLELATLDRPSFLEMVNEFPSVRERLISQVFSRLHSDRELTPLLDEFTEQGLYEAQSVLVIDLDHCTRCDDCTRGCIKQHGTHSHGVPIPRLLRDGRRFANYMVATSCRSCVTPHCMEGCPVDAIHRGKHLQIVIEDHCIGCGLCADNCPYGSIFITENHHHAHAGLTAPKAATCDLCDAKGELASPDPTCVAACPHDAAFRMSGDQLLATVLRNTKK